MFNQIHKNPSQNPVKEEQKQPSKSVKNVNKMDSNIGKKIPKTTRNSTKKLN